jgi:hypothetical protein
MKKFAMVALHFYHPLIMIARIWNHLPKKLKSIENVKSFTKVEKVVVKIYVL